MTGGRFHLPPRLGRGALWIVAALLAYKVGRAAFLNAQRLGGIDFFYFWDAAGHLLSSDAFTAYSLHPSPIGEIWPLAHPPAFLLFIAPLGLMDFGPALAAWLLVTGALYLVTARQPLRLALANPAAAYNGLFGQTGFLTSAIMLGAASLLARRPLLAGFLFGCMVIKPHLALFVPLALVAGRLWSSLVAAVASAAGLSILAAILFGPAIYSLFVRSILAYASWLAGAQWDWSLLASPYALIRQAGLSHVAALAAHAAIAAVAGWLVWRAWGERWDSRVAVLAVASMLGSPYLFTYDGVLLVAPVGYLAMSGNARWAIAIGLLLFIPLAGTSLLPILPGASASMPNMTAVAAVLSLLGLWRARPQRPK